MSPTSLSTQYNFSILASDKYSHLTLLQEKLSDTHHKHVYYTNDEAFEFLFLDPWMGEHERFKADL